MIKQHRTSTFSIQHDERQEQEKPVVEEKKVEEKKKEAPKPVEEKIDQPAAPKFQNKL